MSYQLVTTSDLTGGVDADADALAHRVSALVEEGYTPVGGPVVRNNPEVGDYFVQAMFKPAPVKTAAKVEPVKKTSGVGGPVTPSKKKTGKL